MKREQPLFPDPRKKSNVLTCVMSSRKWSRDMMRYRSHFAVNRLQSTGSQNYNFSGSSTAMGLKNTGACAEVVSGCSSFAIPTPGSELGRDAWRVRPLVVPLDCCRNVAYRVEGYIETVQFGQQLTHASTRTQPSQRHAPAKTRNPEASSPLHEPPATHNELGSVVVSFASRSD